jgi:hypothetical protein
MAEETKRLLKREKLYRNITARRFTFEESRDDLELLNSVCEGTCTKEGDPSFHAYAAANNIAKEFNEQALDILELIPFNNELADVQDEYEPSYPPISPVTSSFFAGWMLMDAQDSITGVTLGKLFSHYLHHATKWEHLRKALVAMNDSYCSFYEVMDVDANGVKLWDIAGEQLLGCWNSSGYPGLQGEIWYARVLPPFGQGSNRSVTASTPYVFRDSSRITWENFFQRHLASKTGAERPLKHYLKYGKSLEYWLEFVFQAFKGYTGNMIFVTGVPDDPASLPHCDPRRKL